jgi:hypothetical protein
MTTEEEEGRSLIAVGSNGVTDDAEECRLVEEL